MLNSLAKNPDTSGTVLGAILAGVQLANIDWFKLAHVFSGDPASAEELSKVVGAIVTALLGYVIGKHKPPAVVAAFAIVCILSFTAAAQTKTTIVQVKPPPVTLPSVVVLMPGAPFGIAALDPTAFTLDTTGAVPIVRVKPSTSPWAFTEVWNETSTLAAATPTYSFAQGSAGSAFSAVRIYRNGVRLTPGADYTIAANTITFVTAQTPQAADILTLDYRFQ